MAVPVPTANVGGRNYFTGQAFNYSGSPYTPLYDQTGTLQGFSNRAGAFVDPNSALAGLAPPKINVSAGAGGGAAAGPASYLNTTAGTTNMPAIQPGSGAARMYYSTPSTGPGAAAYDPNTYTMAAGVNQFAPNYMGYQIYTSPSGQPAAYDPNTGTFGQLQGNNYIPYSRDVAMQKGLISASTAPALPEQNALGMMGQIDPTGEALRQSLGQSYLSSLNQAPMPTAPTMTPGGQAPQAADVQGYLNLYKQIDPEGYAQHAGLATSMDQYVQQMQQQAALGTQLDPETEREITQATRQGQVARGNVYGTPQLMQEAITRGQAGLAIQQQRQAQLASALGQQQGYLSSGMGLGDIANTLYQQGFTRNLSANQQALNLYQAQLAGRGQAQQGALGYLGSGQTPLGAATSYMGMGEQAAAAAAQGGPQYNPASLSPTYTGAGSSQFPQYGIDTSQLANQWYNSLGAYGGQAPKSGGSAGKAASGALSGAASGAALGTAIYPGIGTAVGAIGGAVAGGAGGYFA